MRTARPLRWWIGANGPTLRLMDVSRAYSRRAIDFDLDRIEGDERAARVMQRLFDGTIVGSFATLEAVVNDSDQHRAAVGRSLQTGVEERVHRLPAFLVVVVERVYVNILDVLLDAENAIGLK